MTDIYEQISLIHSCISDGDLFNAEVNLSLLKEMFDDYIFFNDLDSYDDELDEWEVLDDEALEILEEMKNG